MDGIFACGNVLHVHDLVDFVSQEAATAGKNAAIYIKAGEKDVQAEMLPISPEGGVRYTVPSFVRPSEMEENLTVRFRVGGVYTNCYISAYFDDERVIHKKRPVVAPGEMEEIKLTKEQLLKYPDMLKKPCSGLLNPVSSTERPITGSCLAQTLRANRSLR